MFDVELKHSLAVEGSTGISQTQTAAETENLQGANCTAVQNLDQYYRTFT